MWWCVKMGRCMTLAWGVPLCMLTYTHSPRGHVQATHRPCMQHACNSWCYSSAPVSLLRLRSVRHDVGRRACWQRCHALGRCGPPQRLQCVPSLLAAAVVAQEVSCARVTCSGLEAQRIGIPSRG